MKKDEWGKWHDVWSETLSRLPTSCQAELSTTPHLRELYDPHEMDVEPCEPDGKRTVTYLVTGANRCALPEMIIFFHRIPMC